MFSFIPATFWIMVMTSCHGKVCYSALDTFDTKQACEEKAAWVHMEYLKKGHRMKPTCIPSWSALNMEHEK
jgi:hypothetical protein